MICAVSVGDMQRRYPKRRVASALRLRDERSDEGFLTAVEVVECALVDTRVDPRHRAGRELDRVDVGSGVAGEHLAAQLGGLVVGGVRVVGGDADEHASI